MVAGVKTATGNINLAIGWTMLNCGIQKYTVCQRKIIKKSIN